MQQQDQILTPWGARFIENHTVYGNVLMIPMGLSSVKLVGVTTIIRGRSLADNHTHSLSSPVQAALGPATCVAPSCVLLTPSISLSGVRTSPHTLLNTFTLSGNAEMSAWQIQENDLSCKVSRSCWAMCVVCVCVCVHKDTVVTERDLLVILVIELQSIKADVVRVAPRRQQLQLEDNWQNISQGNTHTHTHL